MIESLGLTRNLVAVGLEDSIPSNLRNGPNLLAAYLMQWLKKLPRLVRAAIRRGTPLCPWWRTLWEISTFSLAQLEGTDPEAQLKFMGAIAPTFMSPVQSAVAAKSAAHSLVVARNPNVAKLLA